MKRSYYGLAGVFLAGALAAGVWFATRPAAPPDPAPPDPRSQPAEHAREARARELAERFQQGVVMLHAKRYEHALTAFHRALELAPRLPEAHVNMGYALLGLKRYQAAHDFFMSAIEIRPNQANTYYGLALSLEALGDLPGARGAMRSYIHLTGKNDPYVRKARAALWEWEEKSSAQSPAINIPIIKKTP